MTVIAIFEPNHHGRPQLGQTTDITTQHPQLPQATDVTTRLPQFVETTEVTMRQPNLAPATDVTTQLPQSLDNTDMTTNVHHLHWYQLRRRSTSRIIYTWSGWIFDSYCSHNLDKLLTLQRNCGWVLVRILYCMQKH